jgi:hypothetical protein
MVGVVPAVEGCNFGVVEGLPMKGSTAVFFAKRWVLCEQTKSDEQVCFPAAHSLLQVKHSLSGDPGKTSDTFAKEILHSLGYVRLFEERGPVTLGLNQIVELLNLITELDG